MLLKHPQRVLSKAQLQEQLYDWSGREPESNALEVHIHRLRRKIHPDIVRTVRGVGYALGARGACVSLQRRLLVFLLFCAPLVWGVALLVSASRARHEVNELYDTRDHPPGPPGAGDAARRSASPDARRRSLRRRAARPTCATWPSPSGTARASCCWPTGRACSFRAAPTRPASST